MESDDVRFGAPRPFRDLGQVGPVGTSIAHRDLDQQARRRRRAVESAARIVPRAVASGITSGSNDTRTLA